MDLLLVDDSKTMRLLVQRAIRQAGYRDLTVWEAESGTEAMEKLRVKTPSLILSDWNMPGMSGIDFLRKLREEDNRTPFGFITSEGTKKLRDIAINSGASFIIVKPFSVDDLQAALDLILGRN